MAVSSTVQLALQRYRPEILQELHRVFLTQPVAFTKEVNAEMLVTLYGQIQYHLGWFDQQFCPIDGQPGKLLRPTLLLLSYELAWTQEQTASGNSLAPSLQTALHAAASVELAHNFSLLHDDIEDGDVERRHRPTVWSVWGIPQAIQAGDALFALARLHLWQVLAEGIEPATALDLAELFDMTLLKLTEGQSLDLFFEQQQQVSLSSYEAMISRKTACLMRCATEMGARLGTFNQKTIALLAGFGYALGLAFQIRDDMLGIWATEAELGKQPAGDIYRRKKSLPLLHAFQCAQPEARQALAQIYAQEEPITSEQVQDVLAIFARTQTREYCRQSLVQQCRQARSALAQIATPPHILAERARVDLEAIVDFIEQN
jgi:geranylgeranyl diphosphate synthase, type I